MPLYDFRCPDGHVTEVFRSMSDDPAIGCPQCHRIAMRSSVNRVAITTPEVDIRSKFRRFTEASEETNHAATLIEQSTGQPVRPPNYWQRALAQSRAMDARGESPKVHKEQLG